MAERAMADADGFLLAGEDGRASGEGCEEECCGGGGPCCLPDGSCKELSRDECLSRNGIPQEEDDCEGVDCLGACCYREGDLTRCENTTEVGCTIKGGQWHRGERCQSFDCKPPADTCCEPPDRRPCGVIGGMPQQVQVGLMGQVQSGQYGHCFEERCSETMTRRVVGPTWTDFWQHNLAAGACGWINSYPRQSPEEDSIFRCCAVVCPECELTPAIPQRHISSVTANVNTEWRQGSCGGAYGVDGVEGPLGRFTAAYEFRPPPQRAQIFGGGLSCCLWVDMHTGLWNGSLAGSHGNWGSVDGHGAMLVLAGQCSGDVICAFALLRRSDDRRCDDWVCDNPGFTFPWNYWFRGVCAFRVRNSAWSHCPGPS